MRLLILGGSGMLGHQLWRRLHSQHDTWVTLRRPVADFAVHNLFDEAKAIQFDDITDDTALESALDQAKPEVVINCVGLIKQRDEASDEALTLRVNAEFPHHLAKHCGKAGARLIHFSTDCVFAGTKGNYTESDPSDAADLYGQSKHQGEVADAHSATLRPSVIGHELATNLALQNFPFTRTTGAAETMQQLRTFISQDSMFASFGMPELAQTKVSKTMVAPNEPEAYEMYILDKEDQLTLRPPAPPLALKKN